MSLIDLLPLNYRSSAEVIELQGAFNVQIEAVKAAEEDLFKQFDVSTATWGLTHWEKAYGLKTDISNPYNYRRTRIISKMRGQGSTTKSMIENVAESFSNGEVEVIEHNGLYTFNVKFVGVKGIPPNLDDLKQAIEEIKPAHLAFEFEYTWITWDEFETYNKTWDEWDLLNLTWDDFEVYKEAI